MTLSLFLFTIKTVLSKILNKVFKYFCKEKEIISTKVKKSKI